MSALPDDRATSIGLVRWAGTSVAFGLDWRPIADPARPAHELARVHAEGYRWTVRLPGGDLFGLARDVPAGPPGSRRRWDRAHAAVPLLISRWAERGAEACLIAFDGDGHGDGPAAGAGRVAFVGLMDRRPAPGFDRVLPSLDAALAVLQEFRDMHPGEPVRVASHLPGHAVIGTALTPMLSTLFSQPDAESRLRPLRTRAWYWRAATVGLLALAALGGVGSIAVSRMLEREARATEAAAQARHRATLAARASPAQRAADRERRLAGWLAESAPPGPALLDRWRAAIGALPLSRAGWTLQRVACEPIQGCLATWSRHHGNLARFDAAIEALNDARDPRLRASLSTPATPEAELLGASLQTLLPDTARQDQDTRSPSTTTSPTTSPLRADQLPLLRDALNGWGSQLQDLATVGSGQAALKRLPPPDAEGADPPATEGALEVERFTWRWQDGAWSLPLVDPPAHVVVDALLLTLGSSQVSYELSGSLFALGARY